MRKAWMVFRLVVHLLYGFVVALTLWPLLGKKQKEMIEQCWAGQLLLILNVQVRVVYEKPEADYSIHKPCLLYSNHVSWLDIFAFNSIHPVTFIAKSEISKWPIGGLLAKRSGTLFIERGKRHAVRDVIHAAVKVLGTGRCVAVFPEGTTGAGNTPLHFHSNFVQPAIQAGVPLLPVSLQYFKPDGSFSTEPAFLGDQTILENIKVLLNSKTGFVVQLYIHAPINTEGRTRHELSDEAHERIRTICQAQILAH
ncbi:lysophospholipid acyltransferase family protein [Limnobacter parvus]|uniref:1-acyl-sn-glycerol-3-phosphate acyltransferase n=1 Tax=Limnobacter parvus TaxID=2939690 RepID=A0ABT1XFU8_9BURK|nr:lysophospholipid acyltransferase family protein [Limnobacter parvus]MCR2745741.1 1-acyl-sn-glycerol-3-phosphate acyltransferase [Limnobacter parvus]